MGWAIRRADATYRCWNANTQDDVLRVDETWERFDISPTITPDLMTPAEIAAAAAARFDGEKLIKAVAIWTAQKLAVPLATARSEVLAIYAALP